MKLILLLLLFVIWFQCLNGGIIVDIDAMKLVFLRLGTASATVVTVGEEGKSQQLAGNQNKNTFQFTFWPSFGTSNSANSRTNAL